ncbi:hypothetical protein C4D60_Mb06t08120 [Musa balbisiana]|uniref:Uncharacterized protein n=1 Tax=Musa balbisiana TaxID=52838 RepID=A0A4S8INX5_MUSBA|nr:hypothetical protein C4D60_Mb06t08120 [Musa balbisiana]
MPVDQISSSLQSSSIISGGGGGRGAAAVEVEEDGAAALGAPEVGGGEHDRGQPASTMDGVAMGLTGDLSPSSASEDKHELGDDNDEDEAYP